MNPIKQVLQCDVLVVGAGLAGIRSAYDIAACGLSVILVASGDLCSGSSFYPLTNAIRAELSLDAEDEERYVDELMDTGCTMADRKLYTCMVREIPEQIERLSDFGISVSHPHGRSACFARTERRLAEWSDWKTIREQVRSRFGALPNLQVLPFCDLAFLDVRDGSVCGALLVDCAGSFIQIAVSQIILATGGYCGLYEHSLTTSDVCGVGQALALDAGAPLVNLEFMQFIPGVVSPVYRLLFSEMCLAYCDRIVDSEGKDALRLPSSVSFSQCLHERAKHGPFTSRDCSRYFDVTMMEHSIAEGDLRGFSLHFRPEIMEDDNALLAEIPRFYRQHGIDLERQSLVVAPFAHCANGGILIDEWCRTPIHGLLAAGEVSGGIHGADRHGGTASAVSLVFGARAAIEAVRSHETGMLPRCSVNDIWHAFRSSIDKGTGIADATDMIGRSLGKRLWLTANVLRSEALTGPTLEWIVAMRHRFDVLARFEHGESPKQVLRVFLGLHTAEALVRSILARTESRGSHYRFDYPVVDTGFDWQRIRVVQQDGIIRTQLHAMSSDRR